MRYLVFRRDTGTYEVVRPGKVTLELPVPEHIEKPSYYYQYEPPSISEGSSEIKRKIQIDKMRESCKLAANILNDCGKLVQVRLTGAPTSHRNNKTIFYV